MKENTLRKSIKTEILSIVLISILIITAILGFLSFDFSKRRLIIMLGDSMKSVASTVSSFIVPSEISLILSNADSVRELYAVSGSSTAVSAHETSYGQTVKQSDKALTAVRLYDKYRNLLADIKKRNKIESPINIYVVEKNRMSLVLTSDNVALIGAKYNMRPEAVEAIGTGEARSTSIYRDKDGAWISAYAAIRSPGTNAGQEVIEINYKIDSYVRRLHAELGIILIVCLAGFLITGFISYRMVMKIVITIKGLDNVAKELERGNYDVAIKAETGDEIGHLANTFDTLRKSIKDKMEELRLLLKQEKKAHLESIVALTNAIEMRDPYMKEHVQRVEKYAMLIAKGLHLSKDERERLKYGCFLHDVGKIYVETALLQKTKLSTSDFEQIKKHSEIGARIIEGIQFLADLKDAIFYHQERYDGKGYPVGLKGKEIPLLARIVCVADSFDAMTTKRAYKQSKMTFSEAMDEVERNAGTQFDPYICSVFLKYRNEIEKIANKHLKYPEDHA